MPFDHENLDVYAVAIDFVARANDVAEALPAGRRYLADQLHRAAIGIVLNIAEGAATASRGERATYYAKARGSAMESATVLDVCAQLHLVPVVRCREHKEVLERVTQLLAALIHAGQEA
jgi:four helix bundle protein